MRIEYGKRVYFFGLKITRSYEFHHLLVKWDGRDPSRRSLDLNSFFQIGFFWAGHLKDDYDDKTGKLISRIRGEDL